jgi:hypothetical protein
MQYAPPEKMDCSTIYQTPKGMSMPMAYYPSVKITPCFSCTIWISKKVYTPFRGGKPRRNKVGE